VIMTNLEVARRKPREAGHWEHVADDALAEVKRMGTIVDKLLQLSRAGAAGLQHAKHDLRQLAADAIGRAVPLAEKRRIDVSLASGLPVSAEVDSEAIGIVLDNLLRNSIDHSPDGKKVAVSVSLDEGKPLIVVDDQGQGVPVDVRERIFEPFARAAIGIDRTTGPGLGLGLAICRRIVVGHRGSITCSESPAGGARFTVELPAV
jgi:signal transduction histidine kinase